MEKFLFTLLGTDDYGTFAGMFVLAVFGAIIGLYLKSLKRDKDSPVTPYKFNFGFLLQDNFLRFMMSVIIILFVLRFANEFMGQSLTAWLAFLIGLSIDQLVARLEAVQINARPAPTSPVGEILKEAETPPVKDEPQS